MIQTQLIISALTWERKLEIDDERRKNHRNEPYASYLAPVQRCPEERKFLFRSILERLIDRQPAYRIYGLSNCGETQPG